MAHSTESPCLRDGDHFGEVALLHNLPRMATVRTTCPTILLSVQQRQFLELIEGAPACATHLCSKPNADWDKSLDAMQKPAQSNFGHAASTISVGATPWWTGGTLRVGARGLEIAFGPPRRSPLN